MSSEPILESLRREQLERLFIRAEELVRVGTYWDTSGMFYVDNILGFYINKHQSIYIDLGRDKISLVSERYSQRVPYESLDQLNILHRFFTEIGEKSKNTPPLSTQQVISNFFLSVFKTQSVPEFDTISLFRKAETWWYKSRLSGIILSYCYRDDHRYTFPIPGNKLLHIAIPARYLTDEGVYRLENQSGENSALFNEADCQEEILEAIKYLIEHEEVLKAAK